MHIYGYFATRAVHYPWRMHRQCRKSRSTLICVYHLQLESEVLMNRLKQVQIWVKFTAMNILINNYGPDSEQHLTCHGSA
jgi:hypothetical protein